jgi:hypothetical protein
LNFLKNEIFSSLFIGFFLRVKKAPLKKKSLKTIKRKKNLKENKKNFVYFLLLLKAAHFIRQMT